jgi:hypothetical protein
MIGIVVRTAEYGTAGLDQNIFFGQVPSKLSPPGPNKPSFVIVAHHLPPNQNLNSTYVSDPNGSANRRGPVDDQWRVREYNPNDRAPYDRVGKTGVESPIPPYDGTPMHALMWNGDFSGVGQNRGNCLVHFGGTVGRMSYRVGGPFRPSSRKHEMTKTPEDIFTIGALNIDSLFTNGDQNFDGPLDFEPSREPPVNDGGDLWQRVHLQFDPEDDPTAPLYQTPVGKRRGKWRWAVRTSTVKTPPCDDSKTGSEFGNVTWNPIGGSQVFYDGPLAGGGIDGVPFPNQHELSA